MGLKKIVWTYHQYFFPVCLFFRYDEEHNADDKVFLDCFCKIAAGIKNNSNGHQLKDLILQKGITQCALDYMKKHIPSAKKYGHFYLTSHGCLLTFCTGARRVASLPVETL